MQIEKTDEKLIDLKKLCELLLVKGIASAKKWCEQANIKIIEVGNKMVVSKFLVDIELDRHLVKNLKKRYPTKWIELYKCYKDKDHIGYLSLLEDGDIDSTQISHRVTPISERAKRLANS
ncbi:hypothetical protein U8527_10280 [Kordia algicida OT-1]|uniref:Uncharacterized protein n=1 Tax=Kordia algicida OT-1 TaxID=391587 RepID=A9DW03_9FLAO|nr:hypothetical protein [Kordia algicida]EDP96491.1 hypothetical protein KAOT1_03742 [Kordia algicida OT-1]